MKREMNENLSGNEVRHTACSLLVLLENSLVNFVAKRDLIRFPFRVSGSEDTRLMTQRPASCSLSIYVLAGERGSFACRGWLVRPRGASSLSPSIFVSLAQTFSFSPPLFLSLTVSRSLCFSLSLSPPLSLHICIYIYIYIYVHIYAYIVRSFALCLSLSHSHTHTRHPLSLSLSRSFLARSMSLLVRLRSHGKSQNRYHFYVRLGFYAQYRSLTYHEY